jgi:hypothetical protein
VQVRSGKTCRGIRRLGLCLQSLHLGLVDGELSLGTRLLRACLPQGDLEWNGVDGEKRRSALDPLVVDHAHGIDRARYLGRDRDDVGGQVGIVRVREQIAREPPDHDRSKEAEEEQQGPLSV